MPILSERLSTVDGWKIQVPEPLINLFLPSMERSKIAGKYPRIEIGGVSMRVGKTTVAEILRDLFIELGVPVHFSPEDWMSNPHLQDSYQDKAGRSQALAKSQTWFIERKFQQLSEIVDAVFIQDVSPWMDLGYVVTNAVLEQMFKGDLDQYLVFFQGLAWRQVLAPNLIIFLDASDDILLQRAENSRRSFETFNESYILTMAAVNKMLIGLVPDQDSILYVDTDRNNFVSDVEAQNWLFSLVIKELSRQGWFELEQILI